MKEPTMDLSDTGLRKMAGDAGSPVFGMLRKVRDAARAEERKRIVTQLRESAERWDASAIEGAERKNAPEVIRRCEARSEELKRHANLILPEPEWPERQEPPKHRRVVRASTTDPRGYDERCEADDRSWPCPQAPADPKAEPE